MARGDIPYTRMECTLFAHPVIGFLPAAEFAVWVKLHMYAVHNRRETLELSEKTWKSFSLVCGFRRDRLAKIFKSLQDVDLLRFPPNAITIVGARAKNPGLRWKDAPAVPQTSPTCPLGSGSGSGSDNTPTSVGVAPPSPVGDVSCKPGREWIGVACTLTGHCLPENGDARTNALERADQCAKRYGLGDEVANRVLSAIHCGPKREKTNWPGELLRFAAEGWGVPPEMLSPPETDAQRAARIMGPDPLEKGRAK